MTTSSPSSAADSNAGTIFLYFSPITLLVYLALPHAYLLDITTSYMLKDQLHATAMQVSTFRLLTALPIYLSFVFGFTRDLWSPFGLKDRGFFLIFAPATAAVFLWMAVAKLNYGELFIGMLLAMFLFRFIAAAYQGLMALVGQEKLMSGRLSALWQIVSSVPYVIGGFASGLLAEYLPPSRTFLLVAIITLLIAIFGLWKPAAVFAKAYDKPEARSSTIWGDVKRLFNHRAVYPAVAILFMFQFSPGSNTPLQYYLTDTLHASDAVYGYFYAIFAASFVPMFFLYGWLCKRVKLKTLLWWGTIITAPQMVPLAFIHSPEWAVILAAPIGAMGGIATGAYFDLAIRSCPPGLQGTLMMMVDGFLQLSARGGDIMGATIYRSSPHNGFFYCVIVTTIVYAAILPVLLLIPKELIATRDGERSAVLDAELAAEVGVPAE
jgi:MFS family permease